MTKKFLFVNIVSFTILPLSIISILPYPSNPNNLITYFQNTTFFWIIEALILIVFLISKRFFYKKKFQNLKVVQWYLLWNIFCILRGMVIAETYWDWKGLIGNAMALLIPIVAYSATNKMILQSILSIYIKYCLLIFFFFSFFIATGAFGFYLVPISFLMMFFPVLKLRWKLLVLAFTLLVLVVDLDARSNVIKFGIPIILLLVYFLRKIISVWFIEFLRKLFILMPLILFILAISGVFNIFKMDDYIKGNFEEAKRDVNGQVVKSNLKEDTRTFLYIEVLNTANIYHSWWFGRSPARGNISESFGSQDMNNRGERLGNEVAILNIFTWTGIVGVILYFFVLYKASYVAINDSNNIFSKMMGLFIAFRWAYAWIEDINYFTLTTFLLWLSIGFCFSKSFRSMSNRDIKYWVWGIFNVQYNINVNEAKKKLFGSSNHLPQS